MIHAEENFDINQAHNQLNQINTQLNQRTVNTQLLNQIKATLSAIEDNAEHCVKKTKKDLSQLEDLSSVANVADLSKSNKKTTDFLQQEKIKTRSMLSDCKLLLYESRKLKKQLSIQIESNKESHRFLKNIPFWKVKDKTTLFTLPSYDFAKLYQLSGIEQMQSKHLIVNLFIRVLLTFFGSYFLYRLCKRYFVKNKRTTQILKSLKHLLPLTLICLSAYLFLNTVLDTIFPPPIITAIFKNFTHYFLLLFFIQINFILFSYKKTKNIQQLTKKIMLRSIILLSALLPNSFIGLSSSAIISTASFSGYKTLYLFMLTILFLWTLSPILNLASKYNVWSPLKNNLIIGGCILIFLSLNITALLGYDDLALYFTENGLKTAFALFVILETNYFLWVYARILNSKDHPLSIRFHRWVGLKANKSLIEISILKTLFTIGSIRIFARNTLHLWGIPQYYLSDIMEYFQNEIYLFDIHINFVAILRGLATFCFIIILGRLLGAFIARKKLGYEQKNARSTITTLTNYVTFIIAIFVALMIMGINLTGFALVASALSVGIGFGLKGIAADLISGLILLLSKPLSPGDHIQIKDTEGFIQRIRLLSTEIKTLSEANVILPNSSLLDQSVTNYTYKNKLTRITSHIMLKDIVDVKRTKALMLKIAKKHPDIHQEGKNAPEVTVDARPDKTAMHIVLTLWCIIKDVDDRYRVNSDINSEILAAVEKAKIPLKL